MHEMSNNFLKMKNPNIIDKLQTENLRVKNPNIKSNTMATLHIRTLDTLFILSMNIICAMIIINRCLNSSTESVNKGNFGINKL